MTNNKYLYNGGFAEIVSRPSTLTYAYLKKWFSGSQSLGKAMKLLGLPFENTNLPILELNDQGELTINLLNEEKTLYHNTIFAYRGQKNTHDTPKLTPRLAKLINPIHWVDTGKILLKQSVWINSPETTVKRAEEFVKNIPEVYEDRKDAIEEILIDRVWPSVLAVGILSEFFTQLILQETKDKFLDIQSFISFKCSPRDWFFLSIADQKKTRTGNLSFDEYIKTYGIRADKDYELTCPRWHEIPSIIKKRIEQLDPTPNPGINLTVNLNFKPNKRLEKFITASIELQVLRSEAKRKTLVALDLFRKTLLSEKLIQDKSTLDKPAQNAFIPSIQNPPKTVLSGKGLAVSTGIVSGIIRHVSDSSMVIPEGSMCIFPNASPEFSIQYPKCKGMIFLRGGQTSHGSTVAREFGIPALIDSNAEFIKEGTSIIINGKTGDWNVEGGKVKTKGFKPVFKNEPPSAKTLGPMYTGRFFIDYQNAKYIEPLSEVSFKSLVFVGGKAASLGEMSKKGFPVPEAFVVTTKAFKDYCSKPIPKRLKEQILESFDTLNCPRTAIRSSATSEDSSQASWAGQLESFLNTDKKHLIENIHKCWQSVESKKTKNYSHTHNLSLDNLQAAVIVQKMINARVSGVVFTTNPITKNTNEMLIEASTGLGENIASGFVTPDSFVIDKKTLRIISYKNTRNMKVLTSKELHELAKLSMAIEHYFKTPQDIEWSIEKNKLYILQSRPITTL